MYAYIPNHFIWNTTGKHFENNWGIAIVGQPGIFHSNALERKLSVHPNNAN